MKKNEVADGVVVQKIRKTKTYSGSEMCRGNSSKEISTLMLMYVYMCIF
jgi:hypothetical protein